jgi:hypothetical protein
MAENGFQKDCIRPTPAPRSPPGMDKGRAGVKYLKPPLVQAELPRPTQPKGHCVHDDDRHDKSDPRGRRPRRARWLFILALGSLSLLAAACSSNSGSPGVASVGSTTTTAPASSSPAGNSGASTAGALAYAKCMRTHGLTDFPDPNAQGGFDDLPSNINFNSTQYIGANKVCQPLNGGGQHLSPAKQAQIEANQLKFARCMRSHGVPNYPDPTFKLSGGGLTETEGSKGIGVDPQSPQFQAAQKSCQHVRTAGGA